MPLLAQASFVPDTVKPRPVGASFQFLGPYAKVMSCGRKSRGADVHEAIGPVEARPLRQRMSG
ncbi:hypothetical protein SAMN06272781_8139 [Streptomyces sp. 1222.2]|nr:hypothetical protein SAMN06272781_8139 [Streptomyces sp. 1222.2]